MLASQFQIHVPSSPQRIRRPLGCPGRPPSASRTPGNRCGEDGRAAINRSTSRGSRAPGGTAGDRQSTQDPLRRVPGDVAPGGFGARRLSPLPGSVTVAASRRLSCPPRPPSLGRLSLCPSQRDLLGSLVQGCPQTSPGASARPWPQEGWRWAKPSRPSLQEPH